MRPWAKWLRKFIYFVHLFSHNIYRMRHCMLTNAVSLGHRSQRMQLSVHCSPFLSSWIWCWSGYLSRCCKILTFIGDFLAFNIYFGKICLPARWDFRKITVKLIRDDCIGGGIVYCQQVERPKKSTIVFTEQCLLKTHYDTTFYDSTIFYPTQTYVQHLHSDHFPSEYINVLV